jgi:asparagine synthase (glutamine-hydrolysing)
VALTGDGGDEVFAGYRRFYQIRRAEWLAQRVLTPLWRGLRRVNIALDSGLRPSRHGRSFPATRADEMLALRGLERYKHLLAFFPDAEKETMLTPQLRAAIGASHTTDYLAAHFKNSGEDVLNRYLYLEMTTYLPEDILFKVDIASMANSLECRSPFLDHKLIEFATSLPGRYKLTAIGRHKHILKEAFKDWLPPGFMGRKKKGFSVPLARWLKEDLAGMLHDVLVDKRVLAPWFRQNEVERIVADHRSGRGSHSARLWPLLVLALWVERFKVPV